MFKPRSFANDTVKNTLRYHSTYDLTTYFGGTTFLLTADTLGLPSRGNSFGHMTGGFLDLLTLAHAFHLDRTGVRKLNNHNLGTG